MRLPLIGSMSACLAALAASPARAQPQPPPVYVLPDALTMSNGTKVTDRSGWAARREETLELFRAHVYGRVLGAPTRVAFNVVREDAMAMEGKAVLREVDVRIEKDARALTIRVVLFVPKSRQGKAPVFLLINHRGASNTDPTRAMKSPFWPAEEMLARGYAMASFQASAADSDSNDGFRNGIHGLLEPAGAARPDDAWGTLAAWSWGASRVLDYLVTDSDVDASRVAVLGHSRGGKAALWAGAQDTRFAITISNESGCGGAKISRRSNRGEDVAEITDTFPHWFCPRFKTYANRENDLPVDQHQLMALMAPRAVYVASAAGDGHSDPPGEYLSIHHAGPVFALWGHAPLPAAMPAVDMPVYSGPMGYHIRPGAHDMLLSDWMRFADFADRVYSQSRPPGDGGTAAVTDAGPPVRADGAPVDVGAKDAATSSDARAQADAQTSPAGPAAGPGTPLDAASPRTGGQRDAGSPTEDEPADDRRGRASAGCATCAVGHEGIDLPGLVAVLAFGALWRRRRR